MLIGPSSPNSVYGWSKLMTDTRAAIIKACAERQAIYAEKRERSLDDDDDRRWDEMQMGYEVCTYLLTDILLALDMAPPWQPRNSEST